MTDLQDLIEGVKNNPLSQLHVKMLQDELLINDLWNEEYINSLVVKYKRFEGFRYLAANYYDDDGVDKDRSEFIRLHCELSKTPIRDTRVILSMPHEESSPILSLFAKCSNILKNNRDKWYGKTPTGYGRYPSLKIHTIINGYVQIVDNLVWNTWLKHSELMLRNHPITEVQILDNITFSLNEEQDGDWYVLHLKLGKPSKVFSKPFKNNDIRDMEMRDLLEEALYYRYGDIQFIYPGYNIVSGIVSDSDIERSSRDNVNGVVSNINGEI